MSQLEEWPRGSEPRARSRHEVRGCHTQLSCVAKRTTYAVLIDRCRRGLRRCGCTTLQVVPSSSSSLDAAGAGSRTVDTPSTKAAAAAVTEGGGPRHRSQLHGQRWCGWSCEQPRTAVTRRVCLLRARHDTTFPRQLRRDKNR